MTQVVMVKVDRHHIVIIISVTIKPISPPSSEYGSGGDGQLLQSPPWWRQPAAWQRSQPAQVQKTKTKNQIHYCQPRSQPAQVKKTNHNHQDMNQYKPTKTKHLNQPGYFHDPYDQKLQQI